VIRKLTCIGASGIEPRAKPKIKNTRMRTWSNPGGQRDLECLKGPSVVTDSVLQYSWRLSQPIQSHFSNWGLRGAVRAFAERLEDHRSQPLVA
jgi:hypothetical protein